MQGFLGVTALFLVTFSFINCANASNMKMAFSICSQPNSVQPAHDATSDSDVEKGALQEEVKGVQKALGHQQAKCLSFKKRKLVKRECLKDCRGLK